MGAFFGTFFFFSNSLSGKEGQLVYAAGLRVAERISAQVCCHEF